MWKKSFSYNGLFNILGSSSFKIASSFLSIITVPLLLSILGIENYGTWVTLTAFIGWINMFDFGVGYSLRNRVSEFIAVQKVDTLQKMFIGTFQFYLLTSVLILIIFLISVFFINVFSQNKLLTLVLFIPIILAFPLTISNVLLQGAKLFNLLNLILFSQSILWLISIFILY